MGRVQIMETLVLRSVRRQTLAASALGIYAQIAGYVIILTRTDAARRR